ncbi:MAG: type II toxin-antitoxin system RelE/ParE family toxin [Acidobacteriaceae bacterium]
MKPVVFHTAALMESEDAFAWYAARSEKAAEAFAAALAEVTKRISAYPQHFPIFRRNRRRAVLHTYPYSLIFVEDEAVIRIYAIAHGKRSAEYWRNRRFE